MIETPVPITRGIAYRLRCHRLGGGEIWFALDDAEALRLSREHPHTPVLTPGEWDRLKGLSEAGLRAVLQVKASLTGARLA